MKIRKASEMGFCFGVKRAIDMVQKVAQERGSLQTIGPLVHNKQVVSRLEEQGIKVATSVDEIGGNAVAIASHGVGPEVKALIEGRGVETFDATCPFVRRAQVIAQRLAQDGFEILIYGDANHPEVQGILAWANGKAQVCTEVPRQLPARLGILAQTTQSQGSFKKFLVDVISRDLVKASELRIYNTLCDATRKQQAAALELAREVDLMVVIGGKHSANTRRLAETCAATGVATYHIETAAELDPAWLADRHRIGVSAGASTPREVIDEVVSKLEELAGETET